MTTPPTDNLPSTTQAHGADQAQSSAAMASQVREQLLGRSVVLVGLMGSGKSSVGRRLAARLGMEFRDADTEIEEAAGMSIADIFQLHGEGEFRAGETRVIARLMGEQPMVLATGGGAWMAQDTRDAVAKAAISVWLDAELDILMERVGRRSHRPLLQNADPRGTMERLLADRNPVYALADTRILSRDVPHDHVVDEIVQTLHDHLNGADNGRGDGVVG
ncbi:MAG: shikimate kinase [Pseudomonadota bacterium]